MSKTIILSKYAIRRVIIEQEVTSEAYYNQRLQFPMWPGGLSGITIGFGYDLGQQTPADVARDLQGILPDSDIRILQGLCSYRGTICKSKLPVNVRMTWSQASMLFYRTSLLKHVKETAAVYPGLEHLHPYDQTAIVGLVYNRGGSLKDKEGSDRRKEMRLLVDAVKADDDKLMASIIRQMKRLWDEKKMGGLIARRELEAELIALPDDPIPAEDQLIFEI